MYQPLAYDQASLMVPYMNNYVPRRDHLPQEDKDTLSSERSDRIETGIQKKASQKCSEVAEHATDNMRSSINPEAVFTQRVTKPTKTEIGMDVADKLKETSRAHRPDSCEAAVDKAVLHKHSMPDPETKLKREAVQSAAASS